MASKSKDEFFRRRRVTADETFDERGGDVEERFSADAIFESAKRRWRSEFGEFVGTGMIGDGLPERIGAELLMVVEVFVTAGDAEDALRQKSALRVEDEIGIARIGNGPIEGVDEAESPIGFAEEEDAGIGGDVAAGKVGDQIATIKASEGDAGSITLCHRDGPCNGRRVVW